MNAFYRTNLYVLFFFVVFVLLGDSCAHSAEKQGKYIIVVPSSSNIKVGESITLSAIGIRQDQTIQWFHNFLPIPGATGRSLDISEAVLEDAGDYFAAITKKKKGRYHISKKLQESIDIIGQGELPKKIPKSKGVPEISNIVTITVKPIKVLLLGDSITHGTVSGDSGTAYADLLRELLGDDFEVINIGRAGASSVDWTLSTPASSAPGGAGLFDYFAIPNLPADVVTVLLGTNDAVGFFEPEPISPARYQIAIEEIVTNLLNYGALGVVLMSPPQAPCLAFLPKYRLGQYRKIIQLLCTTYPDVSCGPDLYTLLVPFVDFQGCDVHPNGQGHSRIAEALYEHISAMGF